MRTPQIVHDFRSFTKRHVADVDISRIHVWTMKIIAEPDFDWWAHSETWSCYSK